MNVFRCIKNVPAFIVGVIFALGMTIMSAAMAVDDIGVFELEGDGDVAIPAVGANAINNDNGEDWEDIHLGGHTAIATTGIVPDTFDPVFDDDVLTGGSTKDEQLLEDWQWKFAKPTPDKNNITNAYAAAYIYTDPTGAVGGGPRDELVVYFGDDRFANTGDAQMGFWFYKNQITAVPGVGSSNGSFDGEHADGDILVLTNFSKGGKVSTVQVWRWELGAMSMDGNKNVDNLVKIANFGRCENLGPAFAGDEDACAVANLIEQDSPWDYTPKAGTSKKFPPNSLFEGGINLNDLLEVDNLPCFASFLAETRASTSVDSTLKDFVLADFPLCGVSVTKSCDGDAILAGDGSTVRVNWKADVSSTGAAGIDIELNDTNDSAVTTTIDAICLDGANAGTPNGNCGDGDDIGISIGATAFNDAEFMLGGQETALVKGHYVVTVDSSLTDLNFDDTVTVEAFDISTGNKVADDSSTITCSAPDDPTIDVDKTCSASFTGGDTFTADVQFRVVNDGNILLNNITVSDLSSEGLNTEAGFNYCIDTDNNPATGSSPITGCESGAITLSSSTQLPVGDALVGYDTYVHTNDLVTSHSDTVTVSAKSAFTGNAATGDLSDSTGQVGEACGITPTQVVEVDKVCDDSLGGGSGVILVQQGGVLVVQVGAVITASNEGTEDVLVSIQDDQVSNLDDTSILFGRVATVALDGVDGKCDGTTDTCILFLEAGATAGGVGKGSATLKGNYQPDTADVGSNGIPHSVAFTNTLDVEGRGTLTRKIAAETNSTLSATCELCPEPPAE